MMLIFLVEGDSPTVAEVHRFRYRTAGCGIGLITGWLIDSVGGATHDGNLDLEVLSWRWDLRP